MEERAPLILAVDADAERRRLVGDILRRAGFGVLIAASGADALRLAAASPDLVILAAGLPDLDPLEVGHRIRANRALGDLPIVHVVATQPLRKERTGGRRPGADAYLAGPVQAEELTSTVRALLAVRRTATELHRRRRITEALVDLSVLLPKSLESASVAQRIADSACALLDVRTTAVYELGPSANDLVRLAYARGMPAEPAEVLPGGSGVSWLAIARRRTVAIADVLGDSSVTLTPELRAWFQRSGCGASMAVPLLTTERVVGALFVADRLGRAFTDEEMELAETFANHAAIALENARLYQEAERRRAEAEELARIAKMLTTTLDVPEVSARIVESVRSLFAVESAILSIARSDGGLLVTASCGPAREQYPPGLVFPPGQSIASRAFAAGRPIWSSDIQAEPEVLRAEELRHRMRASGVHGALGVPLAVEGRIIGALSIADRAVRNFPSEEIVLLQAFGDQAALALENARLHAEARRRLAETETLLVVAQVLGSTLESTEMMRRVARESARAFGADMAGAYVPDADGGVLRAVAGYHVPEHLREAFRRHPIPLRGHPFLEEAWENRRPVWSSNVGAEAGIAQHAFERARHRSALFVPMVVMDRAIAALHLVWWTEERAFSAEEIRLAEAIARQAGLAIANAQLYQKSDERRREAESLAAVASRVSASLDPAEVSAAIVDSVLSLFRIDSAILMVREATGRSVVIAASGLARAHFPSGSVPAGGNSVVNRVLATGRAVWSPDVEREPEDWRPEELRRRNRAAGIRAALGVPLAVKGHTIGTLAIADQTVRDFSTEEIALLQAFGDQAAIALENARLYEETERARREAEVLAEIASALNASLDLDEILTTIVTAAKTLTGSERAAIALWDSSMETMTFRSQAGPPFARSDSLRIAPGTGAGGYVLETGRPFRTEDYAGDPRITKDDADAVGANDVVAVLIVPVVSGSLVQGLVYVANGSADPFTDEDEAILVRLADHAAIAVTNAQLFAREKAARAAAQATADALGIRAAQQAAAAELGQRALSDEDLTTLMADAAALVARNLSAEYSEILEVGSDGADFLLRTGFGWSGDEIGRARRPGGPHTPGGACLQFGEPVVVEDVDTDARFSRSAWLDDYGIVSSAIVAIEGLIPPFGVLAIHTTRRRTFSADDISVLRAVANVLGLAMLRRRTEDIFRQHVDRLAILREVDEAILAAESPRAIADAALRHLLQLIPSWRASVTLLDLDHSIGTVFAAVGAGADVLPGGSRVPFEPADIAELRNDDALVVQDTSTDPRSTPLFRDLVARGIRGFVLMPLAVEGRLMGSLSLAADRPNFFTAEHVEIAREAAKPLALALHHARLRNEMREGRERLQALSRRLVDVQEEERRRLARDLHDEIGQILTGLKFTLASSDRCADAAIRTDLTRATDLVSDLIGRVRELSLDLRPSMLDDLGLVPALLFHVDRYTAQTKVRVRMEHSGIEGQRFPREIETAAYRIVQEALTNVARHAGVEAAIVRVWTSGAALGVQIADEGCGCDPVAALQARDGGLAGMRERAALLGGQLDVESSPGAGVCITATLPLDEPLERRRALR